MSIISEAFNAWRECRAEYDDTLYSQYEAAEAATNGAMLNARGREKGIDPFTLFMGTEARALAYASEELVEYWQSHPRITFAKFERQWQARREVTLAQLRIVDMIHEGKPACRLCGQIVNHLDKFGLCSKTSDAHQEWRGVTVKKKVARR